MTSSNEKILLEVPQVSYKHSVGTLYLMEHRIVWKVEDENTDNVSISHLYCDIKKQEISPSDNTMVRIKIVLCSDDWFILHFINSGGVLDQLADLDRVKVLLYKLLQKCKQDMEKILKDKQKFLVSHPNKLQVYKDLVASEIITPQDFWVHQTPKGDWVQEPSEIGVSSAFLSGITLLDTDRVKYNITPDTIESIFKIYPSIKKLYKKLVPTKLTLEGFWAKFINSHYFRKNKKYLDSQDLFTKCSKKEDEEMKKMLSNGVNDPSFDIASFDDKCQYEGYGLQLENSPSPTLIGRINRQTFMICKELNNQMEPSGSRTHKNEKEVSHINKKQKLTCDLEKNDNNLNSTSQLHLTKVERYMHGPRPKVETDNINPDERISITTNIIPKNPHCKAPAMGFPSSSLTNPGICRVVPNKTVKKAIKNVYLSLSELLNQFWKCFPLSTPQLEEKMCRMHAALTKFRNIKLKPFEDNLRREWGPAAYKWTKHLNEKLKAADRKFKNWLDYKSRVI